MKIDSTTHLDNWKFGESKNDSFIEKFDLLIVTIVFLILYFILF